MAVSDLLTGDFYDINFSFCYTLIAHMKYIIAHMKIHLRYEIHFHNIYEMF